MGRGRPRIYKPSEQKKKQLKLQDAWDKANTKKIAIKFMVKTEKDLLDHLDKQPNKAGYIKQLIREDMKKGEH